MKPGGIFTETLVVPLLSRSFGTRTSSLVKPPEGTSSGCNVTWAWAAAGRASAPATTTSVHVFLILSFSFVGCRSSPDWHLYVGRELVELRHEDSDLQAPVAARHKVGAADRVVARAGPARAEAQGPILRSGSEAVTRSARALPNWVPSLRLKR